MQIRFDKINLPTEYPFDIRHMSLKPSDSMRDMHYHACLEIALITGGQGSHFIENKEYKLSIGDIVIINNVEPHRLEVYNEGLSQILLIFNPSLIWSGINMIDYDYLKPFIDHGFGFNNLLSRDLPLAEKIKSIILDILEEFTLKTQGWQLMIKAKLLSLLTLLYRHYRSDENNEKRRKLLQLNNVFNYIENNYSENITLKNASDIMHFTPEYFSSYFKSITNISFIDFVIKFRVNEAVKLLKSTDYKITDIAHECGFNNIGNFNEAFKKHMGVTPSNIRKNS